jgi:putative endopeptidase
MTQRYIKPLALAIGLGLAGLASAAVFDASELNPSLSPCQDFNGFVNAKWVAANPIPADETSWGSFYVLRDKSLEAQHQLVQDAAKNAATAQPGSVAQKIGWLYASGMDEAAIDKAGFDPIKPELASIAALKTPKDIVAWLQQSFAKGDEQVFRFGAGADFKNAKMQIANADQGGLSLPTTDYYSKPEYKDIRDAYVKHVTKLFELTGVPAADAAKKAANVLAFETRLAQHSIPRVEMRKPENQYHFVSVADADKVTPHFEWNAFFKSQGIAVDKGFSLSQPKFFAEFDKMLTGVPAAQWRDYLSAHTIAGAAPYLSKPFQDESFAFNGKTLGGQPEQQVRWKRVLAAVNRSMGQGLANSTWPSTSRPRPRRVPPSSSTTCAMH